MDVSNEILPNNNDGTSRKVRFNAALNPRYVQPFDFSTHYFLRYIQEYAKHVTYYNDDNQPEGNWSRFLHDPDDPELNAMADYLDNPAGASERQKEKFSQPHVALFLSFLGLLRHAQQQFNQLPARHLDYFYNKVLGLYPGQAKPDSVNVLFNLTSETPQFLLPAGTTLSAGDDQEGNPLLYKTDNPILVNHAKVTHIKNLFLHKLSGKLYAATAPASLTATPDNAGQLERWKTFGSTTTGYEVRPGLCIASPVLVLSEGTRTLIVEIKFEYADIENLQDVFNTTTFYISTGSGMMKQTTTVSQIQNHSQSTLNVSFTMQLDPGALAIEPLLVPLPGYPNSPWPLLKIEWSKPQMVAALKLTSVSVTTEVTGLSKLVATNTRGALDVSQPFEPFGYEPLAGTVLQITHRELVLKRPETLNLKIEWAGGIPDLNSYYQTYNEVNAAPSAASNQTNFFTAQVSILLDEPGSGGDVLLFEGSVFSPRLEAIPKQATIAPNPLPGKIEPADINNFRHLSIRLTGDGFLQEKYPFLQNKLSQLASEEQLGIITEHNAATNKTTYTVTEPKWAKKTLPPPFVPKILSVTIDYTATASTLNEGQLELYALHPFGYTGPHQTGNAEALAFPYVNEGELYIGLEGTAPPQNLSVLFQLSEGSAVPEAPEAKLSWSYLQNNRWVEDQTPASGPLLLSDNTDGLLQSGIIQFALPPGVTTGSTLMPPGMFWLRATTPSNKKSNFSSATFQSTDAVGDLLAVHTQAVQATFQNNYNTVDHYLQPLKPLAITGLVNEAPAIDKVIQPYSSFGGRPAENEMDYHTRVSERLRHKNRALSSWDYERLVLENFQEIHKVKCISARHEPGQVSLVVVPNIRLQHPFTPFEPKAPVKTLRAIEDFLAVKAPPFVAINVNNPGYSIIQLKFQAKFNNSFDPGYYINVLQEALKKFLSPWAYNQGADMEFDQTIYAGGIAYFIEQQPYVDFIASLELFRFKDGKKEESSKTSLSNLDRGAIWVSAQQHYINVIRSDTPDAGIGSMRVEYDFQLAEN